MKILYIASPAAFGGSTRSLFEAIRSLPPGRVEACFVAVPGTAVPYFRRVARDVVEAKGLSRFDTTRESHYQGVRWLVLLREIFHFPFTLAALLRARRRWGRFDIIHGNDVTELPSMVLAKWLFGARVVMHARSVVNDDPASRPYRWLCGWLRRNADVVVAIDQNVADSLDPSLRPVVIHNSFTQESERKLDPAMEQRFAALPAGSLKIGFVGNLHRNKGILDLVRAARLVVEAGHNVDFVIIGGKTRGHGRLLSWALLTLGLQQDADAELQSMLREAPSTAARIHFFGATHDVQGVYERIDVLCFPSHFDAPGRPIFESAFSGVPSIAAISAPRPDTFIDGETGLAVPPQQPRRLADAIIHFATHREDARRMGANALALAQKNFNPATNSLELLAVYERIAAAGTAQ